MTHFEKGTNSELGCDNEPAIEALAREIASSRRKPEPCQRHHWWERSNGIIERTEGLVVGQARTLKAAFERRVGARVPPDVRILCWLVEFAAYLLNRRDMGSDGMTPTHTLHGRRDNTPNLEFGEKILYMPVKPARGGKVEPRFHPGVFVGLLNPQPEAVIVTEQGSEIKNTCYERQEDSI